MSLRSPKSSPAPRWAAALLLLSATVQAGESASQGESDPSRLLFEEARQRMAERRYETACALFEQSLQLHAGIGTAFNLAQCLEKTGKNASAWELYRSVAEQAAERGQAARAAVARDEAARLEPGLSRLVVEVSHPVPELTVTLQGEVLSQTDWGRPMPLDARTYQIHALAPGHTPWTGVAEVESGPRRLSVQIPELQPLNTTTANQPAPDEPATVPEREWYRQPTVWFAAGTASLLASSLFLRSATISTRRQQGLCQGNDSACPQQEVAEHDHWAGQARQALTRTYVLAGLGTLGLGAGIWLWRSGGSPQAEAATANPRAWVAIEGLSLQGHVQF